MALARLHQGCLSQNVSQRGEGVPIGIAWHNSGRDVIYIRLQIVSTEVMGFVAVVDKTNCAELVLQPLYLDVYRVIYNNENKWLDTVFSWWGSAAGYIS